MNRFFVLLPLLAAWPAAAAQAQLGNPLKQLLRRDTTAAVRRVMANPDAHRVQIIYTQIRRDAAGKPHFKSYAYRLKPSEYFYPASTVKLPAAAVALQKMRRLNAAKLERETPLRIDSAFAGQTRVLLDSSALGYRPTIGQYIRKVLLVSDNEAFNRLYEYVGQQELNRSLQQAGLANTRIIHRLSVGDKEPGSRHTNPVTFFADTTLRTELYRQPAAFNESALPPMSATNIRIGKAYMEGNRRVEQPLDFSTKNEFPLRDQQQVLRLLLFPESVPPQQRFDLAPDEYAFLRKYMRLLPRQSRYPRYNPTEYPDNYAKFLLAGGKSTALPEGVRIYNKIGQAYGFLIDNACIVDSLRGVEFMLSAVVYANHDEVLNDDQYDYDTVGFPFLRRLGELVYQYELGRTSERRREQVRTYWSEQHERATP
ncbi:class A beta-lactamase-related serine hydrolase [Hymenobacter latericus]|uniref:class A beta-lactamase-related serine hydrolase n=1 Tax=Hymenobacter sp. YIM 151858-1 TaxID=2987688 RepID=UPI002227A976|nr:class A beta-lactamase-related serine hydrolase [Hymenobacter sp. YIM 151858-1]UYZ59377.1 class A beta-lactamase-related serine hydrolase [Hymenobacter sp. YIM 151858-1]